MDIFRDAPTPSCHAATLVANAAGEIVAAWFGGEYEKHPEVAIYSSILRNGHWTPPQRIAGFSENGQPVACWNPVLSTSLAGVQCPQGKVHVAYTWNRRTIRYAELTVPGDT